MATTVVKAIKAAGGGDYTTLVSWELGQRGNIVTRDTIETAEIYSGGSVGPIVLDKDDWTVDSTHYVHIRAAAGEDHAGIFNASKAYIQSAVNGYAIVCEVGFTRIGSGISIANKGGVAGAVSFQNVTGGACIADGIIARAEGAPATWAFSAINGGAFTHIFKNCVCHHGGASAYYNLGVYAETSSTVHVKNCTLDVYDLDNVPYGCLEARNNSVIVSQNNYIRAVTCYRTLTGGTITKGDHDATVNTEALTPALRSIAYSTANFINVTAGSEDFHLKLGSALVTKGKDLADVTTDFEGTSRVGLVYDIGADQFSDVPLCWNYTARYKGSNKLFKLSGCGLFPRNLIIPSNVDTSTGKMIDDGEFIDPSKYKIIN